MYFNTIVSSIIRYCWYSMHCKQLLYRETHLKLLCSVKKWHVMLVVQYTLVTPLQQYTGTLCNICSCYAVFWHVTQLLVYQCSVPGAPVHNCAKRHSESHDCSNNVMILSYHRHCHHHYHQCWCQNHNHHHHLHHLASWTPQNQVVNLQWSRPHQIT